MSKDINTVVVSGRVSSLDEKVRDVGNTQKFEFSIASSGFGDNTNFFNVVMWGKKAEVAHRLFKKGSYVVINGDLRHEKWTNKAGENKQRYVISTEDFEFLPTNSPPKEDKVFE